MSAPPKTNTPAPSTGKRDWVRVTEKRAQGDTEERQAEAAKKVRAAEETARQREEAEASKQKSVATKKQAREENMVAGPSGMPGPGLR